MAIYFTGIIMVNQQKCWVYNYHDLVGKIEEYDKISDGWWHYRLFDKIKETIIGFKNFDDTEILIETDDKLPDDCYFEKCYNINYVCYKRW